MKNKQWLFNDKAGEHAPAFYHAFACMDGPVVHYFIQAHLDLLCQLMKYLRRKD